MSVAGAPERTGYVPSAFAEPLSSLGGGVPAPSPAPRSWADTTTTAASSSAAAMGATWPLATAALTSSDMGEGAAAAAAATRAASTSIFAATARTAAAATATTYGGSVNPNASLINTTTNTPDEFAALFASHETWFKAATQKRADVYESLQNEAGDILRMLQESEARSQAVLSRIGELDVLIVEEKVRLTHA